MRRVDLGLPVIAAADRYGSCASAAQERPIAAEIWASPMTTGHRRRPRHDGVMTGRPTALPGGVAHDGDACDDWRWRISSPSTAAAAGASSASARRSSTGRHRQRTGSRGSRQPTGSGRASSGTGAPGSAAPRGIPGRSASAAWSSSAAPPPAVSWASSRSMPERGPGWSGSSAPPRPASVGRRKSSRSSATPVAPRWRAPGPVPASRTWTRRGPRSPGRAITRSSRG